MSKSHMKRRYVSAKARKKAAKRSIALQAGPRRKRAPLRQYGCIPVRTSRKGDLQVLLVTSRGTGRWVVPKGWRMSERTPAGTAEREAFEEAGIKGSLISRRPVGTYRYRKSDQAELGDIQVALYVLEVEAQMKDWPECGERRIRWFSVGRAAALVHEHELAVLLRAVPHIMEKRKTPRR